MTKSIRNSKIIPTTPSAALDVFRLGTQTFEMWFSAAATINARVGLWMTTSPFDAEMIKENRRMVSEKLEASREIGLEMQKARKNMLTGGQTPWWTTSNRTLKPLHKRTTANSKRLY